MSDTTHDLQMIDETLRRHAAVAVSPAGVVAGVGDDVDTALRRAGVRAVGATVYVRPELESRSADVRARSASGTLIVVRP